MSLINAPGLMLDLSQSNPSLLPVIAGLCTFSKISVHSSEVQVFVVENGIAKLRDISVGGQFGTFIEIIVGLNEGDLVVTSGQNLIQNNFKVEIVQ